MFELHAARLAAKSPSGSLCADDWNTPVIDGLTIGQAPSREAVSGEARSPRGRICIYQDRLDHGFHRARVVLPDPRRERCGPRRRADAGHPSQRAASAAGILGTLLPQTDPQSRRSSLRWVPLSAVRASQPTGLIVGVIGAGFAGVVAFLTKERGKRVRNWLLSLLTAFLLATEIAVAHPKQPPAQAADVGFTTPALIADFSASNASSLINCTIGDQTPSQWFFQGFVGRTTRNDYTCAQNLAFPYDPAAGKQVLQLKMLESQIVGYPCNISGVSLCNGTVISTSSSSADGIATTYPMGYYEWTFRTSNNVNVGNVDWSFWSWVNVQDTLEIDFDQSQSSGTLTDNGGLGVGDWSTSPPGFSFVTESGPASKYKRLGVLWTGNASTMNFCLYINDVQQGCINGYTPQGDQATQRRYIMLWIEPKCGQNDGDATCFGSGWGEVDLFVQRVRVFTCADWQTSMCYTQGPGMVAP